MILVPGLFYWAYEATGRDLLDGLATSIMVTGSEAWPCGQGGSTLQKREGTGPGPQEELARLGWSALHQSCRTESWRCIDAVWHMNWLGSLTQL